MNRGDQWDATRRENHTWLVAVAGTVILLDLSTKAAASALLGRHDIDLPGPLNLRLSHNSGVAFGVGQTVPSWLLLALTVGIVATLAVISWRGGFASPIAAGLVLGGALANAIDRFEAGTVVDMLDLHWWPTFNLADVSITVGVVLLALTWKSNS